MKITDIKQQVRLQNRYSVFVDGKYSFSLSADTLLDQKLYPGQEITTTALETFKKLSQDDKAYGLTLAYVARRLRSEYELRQYLKRKKYDEDLADIIINRLKALDLVNDRSFAVAWVNDRRLLKPTSRRRLVQELRQKRIGNDIIEDVLVADETDEHQVLRDMVERKRRQCKYQDDTKLMQYLARQGFSYGDIKSMMEEDRTS